MTTDPHHRFSSLPLLPPTANGYQNMPDYQSPLVRPHHRRVTTLLVGSYVFDWLCLIVVWVVGYILGNRSPNDRPFWLEDPDISFPYDEHETISTSVLVTCSTIAPLVIIILVALLFIPGPTVPKDTPRSLVWKRKLWELHTGLLGLALSLITAWFVTNGLKNVCGKPRPDLISRCRPDLANVAKYVVGGVANTSSNGQLVSSSICTNTDKATLDDGFRSFPSGHSSSSAAGLFYLSLFLASKFSVTFPFLASGGVHGNDSSSFASFPSRSRAQAYRPMRSASGAGTEELSASNDPVIAKQLSAHSRVVSAARHQAAAAPIYLLILTVIPFFAAVFIASSRWWNFRHHGFDILSGFFIGTITAWFAFRYYHLPINRGAGWAWAPRSADKAFWAGVGTYSYATDKEDWDRPGDEEQGFGPGPNDIEMQSRGLRSRQNGSFGPEGLDTARSAI